MPTYEYQCNACHHLFEQYQSIKADPIKKCPDCGKLKVQRLIGSGGGILFKGSGFYETDYRSRNYQESVKKSQESTSKKSETSQPKKKETATQQSKPKK